MRSKTHSAFGHTRRNGISPGPASPPRRLPSINGGSTLRFGASLARAAAAVASSPGVSLDRGMPFLHRALALLPVALFFSPALRTRAEPAGIAPGPGMVTPLQALVDRATQTALDAFR